MFDSFSATTEINMSQHAALPARYDHVGSFLRPKYLLEAREQNAKGEITPEQLRKVCLLYTSDAADE